MRNIFLLCLLIISYRNQILAKHLHYEKKPKLIVGIVVDQMRYDFLYRYYDRYTKNGFKKLLQHGTNCSSTHYNYAPTFTGPGHASIYTGTTPSIHGIIANNWWDKNTHQSVYCVADLQNKNIHDDKLSNGMSPRALLSTTMGDELRISNNFRSKVIGIALKDRAAILPAGHNANAAYWLDPQNGNFTSSSFYVEKLPTWVDSFNEKKHTEKYLSKSWETLYPISSYNNSINDNNKYEEPFAKDALPIFPYNLSALKKEHGYGLINNTPFGSSLTKEFAIETIRQESLGKDNYTDLLAISFSAPDYIGHQFGPTSVEIEDTYLRLDQDIADLLHYLNRHIKKKNYILFLTADHGAQYNSNFLIDHKIPAGLFSTKNIQEILQKFCISNYSIPLVDKIINQQVYWNEDSISRYRVDRKILNEEAIGFLRQLEGITDVFCTDHLSGTYATKISNGIYPKRSGDLILQFNPAWMDHGGTGTTHGSTYNYDTHIPLLWYGRGIKQKKISTPIDITDIAPTIQEHLNISLPNGCTGNPIQGIFK